jgi:hypothetical protein
MLNFSFTWYVPLVSRTKSNVHAVLVKMSPLVFLFLVLVATVSEDYKHPNRYTVYALSPMHYDMRKSHLLWITFIRKTSRCRLDLWFLSPMRTRYRFHGSRSVSPEWLHRIRSFTHYFTSVCRDHGLDSNTVYIVLKTFSPGSKDRPIQLTPRSRIYIESQLVKKLPAFFGTRRFITVFTRAAAVDHILSYINPVCFCRFKQTASVRSLV